MRASRREHSLSDRASGLRPNLCCDPPSRRRRGLSHADGDLRSVPLTTLNAGGTRLRPLDFDGDGQSDVLIENVDTLQSEIRDPRDGTELLSTVGTTGSTSFGPLEGVACDAETTSCDRTEDFVFPNVLSIETKLGSDAGGRSQIYRPYRLDNPPQSILPIPGLSFTDGVSLLTTVTLREGAIFLDALDASSAVPVPFVRMSLGGNALDGTVAVADIIRPPLDPERTPELIAMTVAGDGELTLLLSQLPGPFGEDQLEIFPQMIPLGIVGAVVGGPWRLDVPADYPVAPAAPPEDQDPALVAMLVLTEDPMFGQVFVPVTVRSGTFATVTIGTGFPPDDLGEPFAAGFLNDDALVDFVLEGGVVMSQPMGDYSQEAEPSPGTSWASAAVTDLNFDGRSDVIALEPRRLVTLLGTGGDALLTNRLSLPVDGVDVFAGDFDGDARGDALIVTDERDRPGLSCPVRRLLFFSDPVADGPSIDLGEVDGLVVSSAAPLDVQGVVDANTDFVFSTSCKNRHALGFLLGSDQGLSSPLFLAPTLGGIESTSFFLASSTVVGDFGAEGAGDGDGTLDVGVLTIELEFMGDMQQPEVRFLLQSYEGTGNADLVVNPDSAGVRLPAFGSLRDETLEDIIFRLPATIAADLDGDGGDAIIVFGPSIAEVGEANLVVVDQGSETQALSVATSEETRVPAVSRLLTGDFDRDGDTDLVAVLTQFAEDQLVPNDAQYFENQGGALQPAVPFAGGEELSGLIDLIDAGVAVGPSGPERRFLRIGEASIAVCGWPWLDGGPISSITCEPLWPEGPVAPGTLAFVNSAGTLLDADGDGLRDLAVSQFDENGVGRTQIYHQCTSLELREGVCF